MPQNFERSQKFFAEPESILELINNFEVYKTFLPGCLESKRLSSNSERQVRGLLDKIYNSSTGKKEDIKELKNLSLIHI